MSGSGEKEWRWGVVMGSGAVRCGCVRGSGQEAWRGQGSG